MKKTITSLDSLKRLRHDLEPEFIRHLLAVVWKVVAAVHCFFQAPDHASKHRQVRAAFGTTRSRTCSLGFPTGDPAN